VLDDHENPEVIDGVRQKVLDVCARFPVYGVSE
jgi:glycine hydroxymethyltransferase